MQDPQEMCPVHATCWDHFPTKPSRNLTSCTCKPHSFPPPKSCRQLPPPSQKKSWGPPPPTGATSVVFFHEQELFHITPAGSIFSSNHHVNLQQRSLARRHRST